MLYSMPAQLPGYTIWATASYQVFNACVIENIAELRQPLY
jgi:hypothetical protein